GRRGACQPVRQVRGSRVSLPAELVERLQVAVRRCAAGTGLTESAVLDGGHSGLTLSANLVDGAGRAVPIVVKASMGGIPPGRADPVLRQARIYEQLRAAVGVAVPEVIFVEPVPPTFFGMRRLRGV